MGFYRLKAFFVFFTLIFSLKSTASCYYDLYSPASNCIGNGGNLVVFKCPESYPDDPSSIRIACDYDYFDGSGQPHEMACYWFPTQLQRYYRCQHYDQLSSPMNKPVPTMTSNSCGSIIKIDSRTYIESIKLAYYWVSGKHSKA